MAAAGQFSWPPAGRYLAVCGQFLVAVVNRLLVHRGGRWARKAGRDLVGRCAGPVVADADQGPVPAHELRAASAASVPSPKGSRLVGHSSTTVTETVYRHQLRPVIRTGADAMDEIFGPGDGDRPRKRRTTAATRAARDSAPGPILMVGLTVPRVLLAGHEFRLAIVMADSIARRNSGVPTPVPFLQARQMSSLADRGNAYQCLRHMHRSMISGHSTTGHR